MLSNAIDSSSTASDDTLVISESSPESSSASARKSGWPVSFEIPTFSYNTELQLAKGNKEYLTSGIRMSSTRSRSDILEKLAETMFQYKAYPSDPELESVAESLIHKHPCLKEPGSVTGYSGWKQSIKFKMGNYRTKLRQHGCTELMVNSLKRKGEDDMKAAKNIKKPRKAEVNFLPNYQQDESEETLEIKRVSLLDEVKKKDNNKVVGEQMEITFPHRRNKVVLEKPMIADFKERWPALFTETQVNIML